MTPRGLHCQRASEIAELRRLQNVGASPGGFALVGPDVSQPRFGGILTLAA